MKLTLDLRDYIVSFDDMMHPNTCDEIVARYLESDKWEELQLADLLKIM